jgi:hypothetical protein
VDDMIRYLDAIVEPTIQDFEDHPTSVRHAFLACVATFHAVDYLAYPKKRPGQLRQKFQEQSKDFKIVDRVAHAFKHVITGDRNKPDLAVGQVIPRPPAFSDAMVLDVSYLDDLKGGVTLLNDGTVDLLATLKRAVVFLRSPSSVPVPSTQQLRRKKPPRAQAAAITQTS